MKQIEEGRRSKLLSLRERSLEKITEKLGLTKEESEFSEELKKIFFEQWKKKFYSAAPNFLVGETASLTNFAKSMNERIQFSTLVAVDNIRLLNENSPERFFIDTKTAQLEAYEFLKGYIREINFFENRKICCRLDFKPTKSNLESYYSRLQYVTDGKKVNLPLAGEAKKLVLRKLLPEEYCSIIIDSIYPRELIAFLNNSFMSEAM